MHEYSIVESLLARVDAEFLARGAVRVLGLRVRVGELSGVDPDLLLTAYETCRPGTVCRHAALDVTPVPVRWTCTQCNDEIPPSGPRRCAACGAPARLAEGDELLLDRIEMEVRDV